MPVVGVEGRWDLPCQRPSQERDFYLETEWFQPECNVIRFVSCKANAFNASSMDLRRERLEVKGPGGGVVQFGPVF